MGVPTPYVLRGSWGYPRRGQLCLYSENDAQDEIQSDSQAAPVNDSRTNSLGAVSNGSSNATVEDVSNYTLVDDEVD